MTARQDRKARLAQFEYCPVCDLGHLNPHPETRDFVICSLCEEVFTVVGNSLEPVNVGWLEVVGELESFINSASRDEVLEWELEELIE